MRVLAIDTATTALVTGVVDTVTGQTTGRAARAEGMLTIGFTVLIAILVFRVHAFLARPIEGAWPYLWIDATYVKVREAGRIVPVAVTIAVGSVLGAQLGGRVGRKLPPLIYRVVIVGV